MKQLDKLFSEVIRRRAIHRVGGCERCLTTKVDIVKDNGDIFPSYKRLHCAHMHPRRNKSVRWDVDNAAGLCPGCHRYLDDNAFEKVEWFKQYLGDKFELLLARTRLAKVDKEAIRLYLQSQLEVMK